MGREYIPTFFLMTVGATIFIWYQFFERPRMNREWEEEAKKKASTAAPESHSKSSE
jgi:hypothetical protein